MKADLFVLYSLGVIAALFLYVVAGGLVVRLFNAMPPITHDHIEDGGEKLTAIAIWPVVLLMVAAIAIGWLCILAYRLSQWSPRRKSALPGARVVR